MAARWTLNRAGIVNVYQYGDETLQFAGGRLLLRGVNGSGKSTAMNMLLPFLLDADTRRIDAAGEQSSVLRSWMLTGRDDPQPSGYLWIEFARPGGDDGDGTPAHTRHLVCGCGIRANRSTERITTWWFVTERRPGVDVALVESRIPLSADALRATLGAHAVFAQDQRAGYRNEIRARLFGGADLEQHIRLLHVVRNPRVGDRVDLDLPDHLVGALPQLSDAAIDDAAQPLEDLEEHRRNVEDLTRTTDTLAALVAMYQSYVRGELRRRGEHVLDLFDQVRQSRRAEAAARSAAAEAAAALRDARAAHESVKSTRNRLEAEIQALLAQPAYLEGQQLDDLRGHVAVLADAVARAGALVVQGDGRETDAAGSAARAEVTVMEDLDRLRGDMGDLAAAGRQANMPGPPGLPEVRRGVPHDRVSETGRPGSGDSGPPKSAVPGAGLDVAPVGRWLDVVRSGAQQRRLGSAEMHRALDAIDTQAAEVRSAERALADAETAAGRANDELGAARVSFGETTTRWRAELSDWADEVDALTEGASGDGAEPRTTDGRESLPAPIDRTLIAIASLQSRRDDVGRSLDASVAALVRHHDQVIAHLEERRNAEDIEVARLTSLFDELLQRREPDPPAQRWQRTARGVTLAELVDFAPDLDGTQRAGLEAAMEGAGLLGAEITSDGSLTLSTGELLALAGRPVHASLGALLRVTLPPDRDVGLDAATVAAVLNTISTDVAADEATAVSVDGTFRIGALRGRHTKVVAEHVGVTARLAALDRARADVRRQLDEATEMLAATDTTIDAQQVRRTLAGRLGQNRPPADGVNAAARRAEIAEQRLGDARSRSAGCRDTVANAEATHAMLAADARRLALRLSLPPDRNGLREVEALLGEIISLCRGVDGRLESLARSHRRWVDAVGQWQTALADLAVTRAEHERLRDQHEPQAIRLATLEDSIGAEYDALAESIELSRAEHKAASEQLDVTEQAVSAAVRREESARGGASTARVDLARNETACVAALGPLRGALALPGILSAAADEEHEAVSRLLEPIAESADGARSLAAAVLERIPAPERVGMSAESVRQSLRQRRDHLGAGWDAEDHQPDDELPLVVEVTGPLVGTRIALADAATAVGDQLRQQSSLLTAKQDQALRNLLQGLVAREVSDKMHAAKDLVALMNKRLATVTTSHGIGASLRWRQRDDLDDELATTIALLAKPPDLRTADEDHSLAGALSTRIDRARRDDPEAPYRSLIGDVLDYRQWHTMAVMIHRAGDTPKLLSRRTALSEGEKKLVSYLPLFAAVAASCDALAAHEPAAPRFLVLDDAFAKVSEDNHPRLFGLLVELELDFIATSERLWGTHQTVPELAITEVLRDADLNIIVLEHSRWNGRTLANLAGSRP